MHSGVRFCCQVSIRSFRTINVLCVEMCYVLTAAGNNPRTRTAHARVEIEVSMLILTQNRTRAQYGHARQHQIISQHQIRRTAKQLVRQGMTCMQRTLLEILLSQCKENTLPAWMQSRHEVFFIRQMGGCANNHMHARMYFERCAPLKDFAHLGLRACILPCVNTFSFVQLLTYRMRSNRRQLCPSLWLVAWTECAHRTLARRLQFQTNTPLNRSQCSEQTSTVFTAYIAHDQPFPRSTLICRDLTLPSKKVLQSTSPGRNLYPGGSSRRMHDPDKNQEV